MQLRRLLVYLVPEFVRDEVLVAGFTVATTLKFADPSGDRTVNLPSWVTTSPLWLFCVGLLLLLLPERMTIVTIAIRTDRQRAIGNLDFIPINRHRGAAFCINL